MKKNIKSGIKKQNMASGEKKKISASRAKISKNRRHQSAPRKYV